MATIKEVKEQLATLTDLDDHRWASFEEDSRAGVQTAIKQRRKAIQAEIAEEERLEMMLSYEKSLYAQGIELIAGVDEVGRGPLAGPVVAAAVILPKLCKIKGLNDSKKIPKSKHEAIYKQVMKEAVRKGLTEDTTSRSGLTGGDGNPNHSSTPQVQQPDPWPAHTLPYTDGF